MKRFYFLFPLLFSCFFSFAQNGAKENSAFPLAVDEQHSLMAAWEKKPVLDSKLVDDMETQGKWKVTSIGQMSYTKDRAKDGKQSLRFSTSMRDTAYLALPGNKNKWGSQFFNISGQAGAASVQLPFETPQDWSKYNRISFWVYVHPTSLPRHNINLRISNEGTVSTILSSARSHYANDLKPGMWNHVIFEMPHLERDKVTQFAVTRELTGNNPGEDEIVTYDIDNLEIQKVETDQYEGWNVAPGKFTFSHIGYRPNDAKIAMIGVGGDKFELIDPQNKVVFSGNVKAITGKNGAFNQLDFTDFKTSGIYRIRCGSQTSNPFPINDNVWLGPITKGLNFYFCERCGYEVPGLHKACHMDWQGFRGDVKKVINGGYHDAGDLSQGIWRTSMATYAMLNNLDVLQERNDQSDLPEKLQSEIVWGLQYLLKTRFGDGYHIHWCRMRMFTDNLIGTVDDVLIPAENLAWENFLAAAVESKAAKVFEKSDPNLARQLRAAAIDDWQAGVASRQNWEEATYEETSWGATSSLLLAKLTGEEKYRKQAAEFGNLIIKCQEQSFVQGIPITGYFYSNTQHQQVIHNKHSAFEEAAMIALAMLCKDLPENQNWIHWYSSAVLYSEYFMKRGSKISAPYNLLPNSVWTKAEVMEDKDEKRLPMLLKQFNEGTRLNDEYVLRTFPIWNDNLFHGNTNIQLSGAWALAEASKLRKDPEGMKLVGKQLEWVMGANPFGQSLMYGSGYDFPPQFAYCLKDIVGSLPVGMDSRAGDMPYWPATNSATYKEMWMEPVSRFMGAVSVYSSEDQLVIPEQNSAENVQLATETVQSANGDVTVTMTIKGTGKHQIDIKAFNTKANFESKPISLSAGKPEKIQLMLKVADKAIPYVAVISVDQNPALRNEIVGAYSDDSILSKK
ncbi:glycoside hydrolase family 9 protein [Dyadobacter psychrophilus]|uniref:N-terminal ig-like domain of cellulase n=1 Tax=Dyadobacter psychrophilus TaxID=651661 RepID=A0A1T5HIY3_9BACT|nr:glycoside hydrolase family 9 protein [Dyadobacter psychrophilus]SKC20645.1 N-terminal ig-like domain of cellulase [Dyadobacter psychrophilus]